ncbi:MAG: YjgP/YjgQ family permease [Candidatus Cloacimonetes bacterium]|nr:YjgP/YjgQ family permease [Candidatus Cloacimonadota bacterium]
MILKRYILKEHIAPFFISLLVVTFVLLIDRIIDLLNLIIEKQLPIGIVLKVFSYSLPYMLALSIPMAILVATILAFGRMSVDREVIAIKSSGINVYRCLTLLIIAAMLLTGLMVYFNHWFLPNTNHKLKNLMLKIAYYKPMTIIEAGEFNNLMEYTVWCGENNDQQLKQVLIYDRSQSRYPRTIYAESGHVSQMDGGSALKIVLNNGVMHLRDEYESGKFQSSSFDEYVVNIRDLEGNFDPFESGFRSDREMTYPQIKESIKERIDEIQKLKLEIIELENRLKGAGLSSFMQYGSEESSRIYSMLNIAKTRIEELEDITRSLKVEFHKKFALSFAIIIFIMIGVPLGLMTRTSGIGMAFSVSSVIFLIYYVALNMGEQLADRGHINPFISMWLSNFVFFIIACFLIWGSIREKKLFDMQILIWKIKNRKLGKTEVPDEVIY